MTGRECSVYYCKWIAVGFADVFNMTQVATRRLFLFRQKTRKCVFQYWIFSFQVLSSTNTVTTSFLSGVPSYIEISNYLTFLKLNNPSTSLLKFFTLIAKRIPPYIQPRGRFLQCLADPPFPLVNFLVKEIAYPVFFWNFGTLNSWFKPPLDHFLKPYIIWCILLYTCCKIG